MPTGHRVPPEHGNASAAESLAGDLQATFAA